MRQEVGKSRSPKSVKKFLERSRDCKVPIRHMEAKMEVLFMPQLDKVMLVTTMEEPDPEGEQATPVQLHTGVVSFHLLAPTTLEIFIKMSFWEDGASAPAAMGAW
jgi:hypothetical protein